MLPFKTGFAAASACALLAFVTVAGAQPATVTTADILANPGETVVLTVQAIGVQIYECKAAADGKLVWTFKEPRAELAAAGKSVGRHFAGPTWQHADGSLIKGKVAARADASAPGAIPWLKLTGIDGSGAGALAGVTTILRTETKGGVASGACPEAGKALDQPYTSDYVFLKRT